MRDHSAATAGTVLAPAGSKAARSRFVTADVDLPPAIERPQQFETALSELASSLRVAVVVPSTDASLESAWHALSAPDRPHFLGGDLRSVGDLDTLVIALFALPVPFRADASPQPAGADQRQRAAGR